MSRGWANQLVVCIPLWLVFVCAAAPTLYLFRRDRIRPGFCRECGYNLTGNVSGRCSECGTPNVVEQKKRPRHPHKIKILGAFGYIALLIWLALGCDARYFGLKILRCIGIIGPAELDMGRMEVPFVMFHRGPSYPRLGQRMISGPIVAVWPDGRIVRAAGEEGIGEEYVEGMLLPAQLEALRQFIQKHNRLFNLEDAPLPRHATTEILGIRMKGCRVFHGEMVASQPIKRSADVAALLHYLMSIEISQPRPAKRPWHGPSRDWYE